MQGMATSGARAHRLIPYDEQFRMLTLPTTYKETATVSPGKGVRLHYLYYWADAFRDPLVERTRVPVRYDPHDVGIAYAFVHHQWVRCTSEHYRIFRGHSEAELLLAARSCSSAGGSWRRRPPSRPDAWRRFSRLSRPRNSCWPSGCGMRPSNRPWQGIVQAEAADPVSAPRTPCTSDDQAVQEASDADDATRAAAAPDCHYLLPEY